MCISYFVFFFRARARVFSNLHDEQNKNTNWIALSSTFFFLWKNPYEFSVRFSQWKEDKLVRVFFEKSVRIVFTIFLVKNRQISVSFSSKKFVRIFRTDFIKIKFVRISVRIRTEKKRCSLSDKRFSSKGATKAFD